ncbi:MULTISPECIES: effector-associated constant component EACC1 [Streptomyces]|uniref:effector-associated constant component EACC1 n=2 Tax=Streptomyces TaxID=1883 RepID=UPI0015F81D95|nr:hypothetical protein [Streptomyces sp. GMR22]MBA6435743.1 hypothetical protein [Streptomyces sp. GMR22]
MDLEIAPHQAHLMLHYSYRGRARRRREGSMQVGITVESMGKEEVLLDLYRWLREDQDILRQDHVSLGSAVPSAGTMGAVEIINLVVGHGLTALNVALAYAAWRGARPTAPAVTVTFPGGSLTLHDASQETIQRVVEQLTAAASRTTTSGPETDPRPAGEGQDGGSSLPNGSR